MFALSFEETYQPILVCDKALAVNKDIVAGGRLDSMEGVLGLVGGMRDWGPGGTSGSQPFVWLAGVDYDHDELDTLEIRMHVLENQEYVWGWGNLECGNLIVHANSTSDTEWGKLDCGNFVTHATDDTDSEANVSVVHSDGDGYVTSHTGHLNLGSESEHVMPAEEDTYYFGEDEFRWQAGYFNLCHAFDFPTRDALDDLALAKDYKTKTVTRKDKSGAAVEKEVIDYQSLPFLADDKGNWSLGDTCGFLLGCVKKLVLKVEELEKRLNEAP